MMVELHKAKVLLLTVRYIYLKLFSPRMRPEIERWFLQAKEEVEVYIRKSEEFFKWVELRLKK